MTRILWHSNAPFTPTGYGQQTSIFAPLLAEHYDVAISSFYGLEGSPIKWEGIPILPGIGNEYGNQTLPQHAARYFGGNPRDGIVLTLMDVWVLDTAMAAGLNMACWVPIDSQPAPPMVTDFFRESSAIPIAMAKFGREMLDGLDPLYVPHGIDTSTYKPIDKQTARHGAFPDDAFVVGIVAANKGRPSRKCFSESLQAFARFAQHHDNAYLYLHTTLDPSYGAGENLPALLRSLQIPQERIRVADQYSLLFNPLSHGEMAQLYSAIDVLLNPSLGEGFGIPVLEAQACGTPAIVTDATAMREVCQAGWHVSHSRYWTGLNTWQFSPDVDDIVSALEDCYSMAPGPREKLSNLARKHACEYDARRVLKQHWLPALADIERRFDARKPQVLRAAA
jgi:glycosyltransferase involved in cell wall biosynthesis